ncbi:hypothetical protein JCM8547_004885 [Rhodosporidiobolus lusitaniae]
MKLTPVLQAVAAFSLAAVTSAAASSAPIMAQYWPAYNSETQGPIEVPFEYADIAYYFLTVTTPTGFDLPSDGSQSASDIAPFVKAAKKAGSKPVFSIGGWDGSIYFSNLTDTEEQRETFVKQVEEFMEKYEFEGVDLDWEYPGSQGIGCNSISSSDSANFLELLKLLRKKLGSKKLITAAVSTSGLIGENGEVLSDFSPYGEYLDYLNLMTYDVSGSWSETTGPNSPLRTCLSDTSVEAAVKLWTSRGFPASKILLGIPSYAISFTTTHSSLIKQYIRNGKWTSVLYQEWNGVVPMGAEGDSNASVTDVCGTTTEAYNGQWQYSQLISEGILSSDGKTGLNGFKRRFDSCSQTPFLFNPDKKQLIAYDDAQSAGVKAAWAKKNGLAGVMIFDSTGFTTDVLETIESNLYSRTSRRY